MTPADLPTTPPALRFARVDKRYGRAVALDGFTLEVRHGECFGLVGVNGAGKTTLLKCLLDFCGLDAGTIDIYGVPHREERSRTPLAFLPERFNPPYYLTGRDLIAFVLSLQGTPYVPADVHSGVAVQGSGAREVGRFARLSLNPES